MSQLTKTQNLAFSIAHFTQNFKEPPK